MNSLTSWDEMILTFDPVLPGAWPWLLAALLAAITVWTYIGLTGVAARRLVVVLSLRLLAMVLVCLVLLRPALGLRQQVYPPAVLLIAADTSESMTIQDEFQGQSRWQYLLQILSDCEGVLEELRDRYNVDVVIRGFAGDVGEFNAQKKADGKRTDFGHMLQSLYADWQGEKALEGLLILSDGADNGQPDNVRTMAAKLRGLPCPVHTFGFGKTSTRDAQNDIAIAAIQPEPSQVMSKGEMVVRGRVDAPGFVNSKVRLRLLLDDKQVAEDDVVLSQVMGNEVQLKCTAPASPGDVKVTLKIDPLPGEVLLANNEMSTYVTVNEGGVSVLFVDVMRAREPQAICDALRLDPRIKLHTVWLRSTPHVQHAQTSARATDNGQKSDNGLAQRSPRDLFRLGKQRYDVIIFGDVTPGQILDADPDGLEKFADLVEKDGAGLLLLGGEESFRAGWNDTPLGRLLPVGSISSQRIEQPVKILPTQTGLDHFVMQLDANNRDNMALWQALPSLDGIFRLGRPRPLSNILAQSESGVPVLIGQNYGKGRTLIFGADTTALWITDNGLDQHQRFKNYESHARFWKQVVLWLGKQDQGKGNAWVRLDTRRLHAGQKLGFNVGLRGKTGLEIKEATFTAHVIRPQREESYVPTIRERGDTRGVFWKTAEPGEYRLVVSARGKDLDGQELASETIARFLVYQDESELARRAADHDFLIGLAEAGGGQFHKPEELITFIRELMNQRQQQKQTTATWPNWKITPNSYELADQRSAAMKSGLLPCLVLFVLLLTLEWGLKRRWGMA